MSGTHAFILSAMLIVASDTNVAAEEPPRTIGLEEEVGTIRTQIEVSVWPKNGNPDLCRELRPDALTLYVNGFEKPVLVDFVGVTQQPAETSPVPQGMRFVIVIDEDALGKTYDDTNPDGPRFRAYREVREFIGKMQPEDQILIVVFKDYPVFATDFTSDKAVALGALHELEHDPRITVRRPHITWKYFFNGWVALLETLGLYEGHKDLVLVTTDTPATTSTETSGQAARIAAAANESKVRIHTLDIGKEVIPKGLIAFAEAGGGKMFSNGHTVKSTVETLRALAQCNVIMTFELTEKQARKTIATRVTVSDKRFTVEAPTSRKVVQRSAEEERARIFRLPHWGRGFTINADLFPLTSDGFSRWNSILVARVIRTDDTLVNDGIRELELDCSVWKEGGEKPIGSQTVPLKDATRAAFLAREENIVPLLVPGVWPGRTQLIVSIRGVRDDGSLFGASVKRTVEIPLEPRNGETIGWFLANQKPDWIAPEIGSALPRIAGVPLIPSLTGLVPQGRPAFGITYGCRKKGMNLVGELRNEDDAVFQAPAAFTGEDRCAWLVTRLRTDGPGPWRFLPPPSDGGKVNAPLHYSVVEATAQDLDGSHE